MGRIVKKWIPVLITTISGLVVLTGYLAPTSALLSHYRDRLIEWAVIIAAFAFILGMFNLLRVHGRRAARLRKGWLYSLVLLLAALAGVATSTLPLLEPLRLVPSEYLHKPSSLLFKYVIRPVGASLAALVVFTLTLAVFRLLRARHSGSSLFFILVVILVLLGTTPLLGQETLLHDWVRGWLLEVPGMAGMRGLLLGVALGIVITALRVFLGSERPQSEL